MLYRLRWRGLFSAFLLVLFGSLGCSEERFSVEKIYPRIGLVRGGEKVVVHGSGFQPEAMVNVYFGNSRVEYVRVSESDEIVLNTPAANKPGKVDVRIIAPDGTLFIIKQGFEYMKTDKMADCVNVGRALKGWH